MDRETRAGFAAQSAAFATLSEMMGAGFARADRHFELQQEQFLELRDRLDVLSERVARLEHEVVRLGHDVTRLGHEVELLRDFVTREIAEIRLQLRGRSGQTEELRREIDELAVRVERLERRPSD